MNSARRDSRTACEYEFDWIGSGNMTFIHNFALPLRHNRYACSVQILVGSAHVVSLGTNSFVIDADDTSAGRGLFKADVKVNDFGEAV